MERHYSITIRAPIEKAFACVDDNEKIRQWLGGQLETTHKTIKDTDDPVGTKFRHNIRGILELDGEIIAYKKPFLLGSGMSWKNDLLKGALFYHFKPISDTTTRLDCEVEIFDGSKAKAAIVSAVFPLFDMLIKSQLKSIKKLAENHPVRTKAIAKSSRWR